MKIILCTTKNSFTVAGSTHIHTYNNNSNDNNNNNNNNSLVLTVDNVLSDVLKLQTGLVQVFNITAQCPVLGLGTGADRPVSRLADGHHVSHQLTEILFLCQHSYAGDQLVLGLVRQG